jgi:hypothetical protein
MAAFALLPRLAHRSEDRGRGRIGGDGDRGTGQLAKRFRKKQRRMMGAFGSGRPSGSGRDKPRRGRPAASLLSRALRRRRLGGRGRDCPHRPRAPCRFGGAPPYFICPGVVNGIACGRRVAKLHRPGGPVSAAGTHIGFAAATAAKTDAAPSTGVCISKNVAEPQRPTAA